MLRRDGFGGGADVVYRLIEADGRLQSALQPRVIVDILIVERLLNHHQLERIQTGEMVGVANS